MENELLVAVNTTVKRCIDIAVGLVGVLVLAVVFVPIAIAIKLDSSGPIFYRQTRCGLRGQPFEMLKFRSMVVNAAELEADSPTQGSNQQDSRISRVGRFLRKTSLDEVPQFWHVLTGEMSLVGTRPPTPEEVSRSSDRYQQLLAFKPGLTGEWQLSGAYIVKDLEQLVEIDQRYYSQWHPLHDLIILWKTIGVVLARAFGSELLDKQGKKPENSAKKNGMSG